MRKMRKETAERAKLAGLGVAVLLTVAPAAAQQTVELPRRDAPLSVDAEGVYTVGGAMEEAEWEIFGDLGPSSLAFDGRGNLHVFDRDNARVVVIAPDGSLLREFGKEGEGPDEWRSPLGMAVMRDGTVVITDMGHRAHLVYGPDGTLERRVEISMEGGGFSLGALQPDPRGGHLYSNAGGGFRVRVNTSGGPADMEASGRAVERLALEDGSKEPFFTAWGPPPEESEGAVLRGGGGTFRMGGGGPRTFEPRLHVGVLSDGGLAVADSSAYAVKMVGPDGTLRRVIRRPSVEPRAVTSRVEEREKERRLEELADGGGPQMRVVMRGPGGQNTAPPPEQIREMQRDQVEQMTFWHEIPVIAALRAGWGGKLWIERTPEDWWEAGPVDVVTAAGEYLGTIAASGPGIPDAFGPGGLAAWIERDELDVPTIVVGRLPVELR